MMEEKHSISEPKVCVGESDSSINLLNTYIRRKSSFNSEEIRLQKALLT